jgi:hypothetical protein
MLVYSILHHRNSLYISHHYYTCYNTKTKPFKVVAHTLPIRSFHVGGIFERTLGLLVSLHRVPNTCETSLPSGSTDSVLGCSGPGCYIHPSSFHPADRLVMSEKHCRSTKLSEQLFEIDDAVYRWALGRYHVTGPDDSHNARRRVLLRFLAGTRFDVVSPVELFADGCKTLFARHGDVVGSFAQHVRRSPSS